MIGFLSGKIVHKRPPVIVIDVGGVGYEVEAPMTTFYDLPDTGSDTRLHTHFVVREDAQLLFGFSRLEQRELFRTLIKVNGVGPRVALAILSTLTPQDFEVCVANDDVAELTRVPGIGKKTAQRILVEMRDRLGTGDELIAARSPVPAGAASDPVQDAVSALVALGYKPVEASRSVRAVAGEGGTSEELIRAALKGMSGNGG